MIIVVRGTPAPQGSKRHVGGGRMIEMSKAVGPWREAVRAETQRTMAATRLLTMDGPVMVRITFYLARPKSAPKKRVVPAGRPDIDKLARAVLDGLTEGGAWLDDGQVVTLHASKVYATEDFAPGCTIEIGLFQS